ncbi:hypothetical protein G7046_g5319 [Stylonectria norvegica]|nr:hypothetical protein G7046_g5319 [Stylonectria norvegica]
MTDKPTPPSTLSAVLSPLLPPAAEAPRAKEIVARRVENTEEEPYTIKCICNFSDDDGNTIYCETCDTWQHIDCFYPNNRDEAIREDFAHSCADCKPRPLDRQKAIERTTRLRSTATGQEPSDKRTRRPPSKSHKKKPKLNDTQINGHNSPLENAKHGISNDHPHPPKKSKTSHRSSQSISSQPSKRSPSYGTARSNNGRPPSPATSPPDLPEDFQIHHYSKSFCDLYSKTDVPDVHNNAFASLAIPTALSRWLREPETMKGEVGRTHADVFQAESPPAEGKHPTLEVEEATRSIPGQVIRWLFLKSTTPIEKDVALIELNGEIGFQKDYCSHAGNLWTDLSSPLPFVFFHPVLPLYIDTRKEGSQARYVRRSCKPNAQLDTYLSGGSEYHFWIVSDRFISPNEPITLPWDFRLEKSVGARWLHLLGLSDDDSMVQNEPEVDAAEYTAISNWIDRILSEYGGCACDLGNNCAFARFHRHNIWNASQPRPNSKKKQRKPKTQAVSPTTTVPTTTSRAASEGQVDEGIDVDGRSQSVSSHSKPPSRDLTPLRQGSFDQLGILTEPTDRDKRKVAMVEDTFRRMEQQQPLKKKKRTSDGTNTSTSSKPKSTNGSTLPNGTYTDSGTRSKSGSPDSSRSPQVANTSISAHQSSSGQSRQSSSGPRHVYCDAAVQTDPVEGEWFSEPMKSPRPKKRIISLSKRLLNNRHRIRAGEEDSRRSSFATQTSTGTAMDIDPTSSERPPSSTNSETELQSPVSQGGDALMADAPPAAATASLPTPSTNESVSTFAKIRTPDLRVQMPPVPAFDNSGLGSNNNSAPLSATSSLTQSPISSGAITNPFAPLTINGVMAHPCPVKKKLSLSDYTKSRMNKAAGKVSGGNAMLKPSMSCPEDTRVDIILNESHAPLEKPRENTAAATPSAVNGHS